MAKVVLNNVWKRYGDVVAVEDVNLEIHDHEFVVLVGPSGCGKSTTLRMVAGLEDISEGQVIIGDRVVNNVAPKDRDIAMVFQSYALYPHWTVYQNMAFGLRIRKMSKEDIRAQVLESARILGIEEYLERKPKALSGGQRQRVAMGRAIVRNPSVFLFDEPLSNLDAKLRGQMRVEISRLHNSLNTTIIYVTHDQIEAMTLADRIVIMNKGRIQQVGSPMELYERPANLFVAGFIGSPTMNFLKGTVSAGAVRVGDWGFPLPPGVRVAEGEQVTIGARPHTMMPVDGPGPSRIKAQVEVVEQMGSENFAYLKAGDLSLTVRLDAGVTLKEGSTCWFEISGDKSLLFGADETRLGGE